MRTRYARYIKTYRDVSVDRYADLLDATGRQIAGIQNGAGYARKRLEIPPPRIAAFDTGQDLSDVIEDLGARLDGLRQAGLGTVAAALDEIQDEAAAIASYLRALLVDFDELYNRADQLTGDLDETQRELRAVSTQRENLANQVHADQEDLAVLRRERAIARQLVNVVTEAEQRRTIKRGTAKRWFALAEQRARGRRD